MRFYKRSDWYTMNLWCFSIIFIVSTQRFSSAEFSLTILHNNDMHSRFEQTNQKSSTCNPKDVANQKCYGGFARVAYAVKKAKRLGQSNGGSSVIFLNAGDSYQGMVIQKWKIVSKLSSMLGIDASCLGNHEFDDGVASLVPFINNVEFPVLASNLDLTQEPTLAATHLNKSVVLNVQGRKIGVDISSTGLVKFKDEVLSVRQEAEALKRQGVNIIIALGHAGYDMDQKIAREVADVDVVVGGHSHTFLYNGEAPDPTDKIVGNYPTVVTQSSGKRVPVVQAYAYTKYLGNLTLRFNEVGNVISWQGNPILLDKNVPEDEDVLKELSAWRGESLKQTNKTIGISRVLLNGNESRCRIAECNMGNLITDAMVDYYVTKHEKALSVSWTDAPIALMNSGGIRSSIDTSHVYGSVTVGDLLRVLPFENTLSMLQIKGTHLMELLEWSVNKFNGRQKSHHGAFLQVSGLRITYDVCRPVGHRVVSVLALCGNCWDPIYKPVESSQVYGIIVPHYIANGGDGYTFGKKATKKELLDITDTSAMGEYIKKLSPVYPASEGRITVLDPFCSNKLKANGEGAQVPTLLLTVSLAITASVFYN